MNKPSTGNVICFFGMAVTDIERFCSAIADDLSAQGFSIIYLVDDPAEYGPACSHISKFPTVYTTNMSIIQLAVLLRDLHASVIVTHAVRPTDARINAAASTHSIPTVYLQHGLYIPHMARSARFLLERFGKVLRFVRYSIDLGRFSGSIETSVNVIFSYLFGATRSYLRRFPAFLPRHAFVWSDYWANWHKEHYYFSSQEICVTGNPDLSKFDIAEVKKPSLLVIYQTLAEDGRAREAEMLSVWRDIYEAYSNRFDLYLKWHPRGSAETKNALEKIGYVITSELPTVTAVVGLYSSLMGVFPVMGIPVFIVEIDGHPAPESIKSFCRSYEALENPVIPVSQCEAEAAEFYFGGSFDHRMIVNRISEMCRG